MIPVGDLANPPLLRDLPPADGPTFLAPIRGFFHTLSVLFEQVIRPATRNVAQSLDNDYQFLVDMYDLGVRTNASDTPASLPTCPNAESITSADAKKFKKGASRTEWGQQAEAIVVNRDSWTMSVYFPPETTDDIDIPLTFNGLPVIPHCINRPHNPTESPRLLTGATSTKISTRLCHEHINSLRHFFRGLVSIDLFRDGIVYLYFRKDDYWGALAKFPEGSFKAWGAVFIIVQLVARLGRHHPARIYPGPVSELYPGSRVHNSVADESTLGTFLRKASEEILPDSQLGANLITVSAHSFVRRRFLRFDNSTISHFTVAIISTVCLWNYCRSLVSWNYEFLIHVLAIKTIMTMCDARWMRAHRSATAEKVPIFNAGLTMLECYCLRTESCSPGDRCFIFSSPHRSSIDPFDGHENGMGGRNHSHRPPRYFLPGITPPKMGRLDRCCGTGNRPSLLSSPPRYPLRRDSR
jgi:hypothetical protein